MDTSTDEDTATPLHADEEQWYNTDWGGKVLQEIYGKMNGAFGKIDMSRAVTTKDISLVVTTDRNQKLTVNFPKGFPNAAVLVSCGRETKHIKVPFNRNAPESEFIAEFCKKLSEFAYDEC